MNNEVLNAIDEENNQELYNDLLEIRQETIEHCNQRKLDNHIGYQSTEDKS